MVSKTLISMDKKDHQRTKKQERNLMLVERRKIMPTTSPDKSTA